jgi:hypothetical protein
MTGIARHATNHGLGIRRATGVTLGSALPSGAPLTAPYGTAIAPSLTAVPG